MVKDIKNHFFLYIVKQHLVIKFGSDMTVVAEYPASNNVAVCMTCGQHITLTLFKAMSFCHAASL